MERVVIFREVRNVRTGKSRLIRIVVEVESVAQLPEILACINARYPRWEGLDA